MKYLNSAGWRKAGKMSGSMVILLLLVQLIAPAVVFAPVAFGASVSAGTAQQQKSSVETKSEKKLGQTESGESKVASSEEASQSKSEGENGSSGSVAKGSESNQKKNLGGSKAPVTFTYICHATRNGEGNPDIRYVRIDPSTIGVLMGHVGEHNNGADIIPPIDGYLPDGQNWDAEGRAIYANNCDAAVPPTPVDVVTITASKVVCTNESDLPDWGRENSGGGPDITETTATNWVREHDSCRLEAGWEFQWGFEGVENPGDNVAYGGEGWNTFGATTNNGTASVTLPKPSDSRVWVREVMKDGYIPFVGRTESISYSAEFYCHTDVVNYDNHDFIESVEVGKTYYCVAWNVPEAQ